MAGNKFISKLRQIFGIDEPTENVVVNDQSNYRSMSDPELKSMLKNTFVPDSAVNRQVIDKMMLPAMLEPLGRDLLERQQDNSKLLSLAPEIEQAASILIPSILSPNDFKKNVFDVTLELADLDDTARLAITERVQEHFGEELGLSSKLSTWLDDAIFKVGSKAVVIFPTSSIQAMTKDLGNRVGVSSLEGLTTMSETLLSTIRESEVVLGSPKVGARISRDNDTTDKVITAIESYQFDKDDARPSRPRLVDAFTKSMENVHNTFGGVSKLIYTDDPRVMFTPSLSNVVALESASSRMLDKLNKTGLTHQYRDRSDGIAGKNNFKIDDAIQYRSSPYLDLGDYVKDGNVGAYPAMLEIPSESVLPIIVEGAPDNHIGYFILLNEHGQPITAESDNWQAMAGTKSSDSQVNQLFNSFYGQAQFSLSKLMSSTAKTEVVGMIYDGYIKNLLKDKLEDQGFNGVAVRMNNDVSRVMLYRLMKNTETRILFVPRQFMHYLAFEYNDDGTGRSKLDMIKFPLALKMTLIITRLISLIESAANRTKLNIALDDTIGNPLEILRSVRKEVLKSKMYGISYDPSTIIKGIVEKSLTVVPDKIPGVESFSITEEPNNVTYPVPDDALLTEINNMYMLRLDVPPSAMNRLSEDEFSKSVASNNIFFSNKLKGHQVKVCYFMTNLIRNYIKHSDKFLKFINEMIKQHEDNSGSGEATVNNTDRVKQVIESISFTLPTPNLAIDRSSFEELREYIEMIEQVLVAILPPELSSNSELADTINTLRSNVKHKLLMEHIQTNSILSDLNFDVFKDIKVSELTDIAQSLMNLKAALELQKNQFSGGDAAEASGETPQESGGW